MFRVEADSVAGYLGFDPARQADLKKLDALIRKAAPGLKRYFHNGTPAGQPGMRFKMIGYGRFHYVAAGATVEWPVIGVALQKNYISVYLTITKGGRPIVPPYAGKLGAKKSAKFNFSFEKFDDLNAEAVSVLFANVADIYEADPTNPVRLKQRE